MRKIPCVALIAILMAMSGCVADSMEDQEEPDVSSIESEVVALNKYYSGGLWHWWVHNGNAGVECRRVLFYNGNATGCWCMAPGADWWGHTPANPAYLIGCG